MNPRQPIGLLILFSFTAINLIAQPTPTVPATKPVKSVVDNKTEQDGVAFFTVKCRREDDSIKVIGENKKVIFKITSPRGIGGATLSCRADRHQGC